MSRFLGFLETAPPYSIYLLVTFHHIEKALDSVSHEFLFRVLNHFNFGDHFISWIKTLCYQRKSYVINNGFLTKDISMDRGIFQGCPISPYLFLMAIKNIGETEYNIANRKN